MGAMDDYDGSPELDVDLELLSVYEKRLERAIRYAHALPERATKSCLLHARHAHAFPLLAHANARLNHSGAADIHRA